MGMKKYMERSLTPVTKSKRELVADIYFFLVGAVLIGLCFKFGTTILKIFSVIIGILMLLLLFMPEN